MSYSHLKKGGYKDFGYDEDKFKEAEDGIYMLFCLKEENTQTTDTLKRKRSSRLSSDTTTTVQTQ
jgi:hypothetical protein